MVASGLLAVCGPALALGFGEIRAHVVLGQPLNLAVPVTLGEGESLSAECVGAEVQSGESRLPPGTVRARVTQGRDATEAVVRVVSNVVIEEPVITLTLSAGCPARITRTLVLFADPPLVLPTTAQPALTAPTTSATAQAPEAATRAQAPAATPPSAANAPPRATRPATPQRATRTASPRAARPAAAAVATPQSSRRSASRPAAPPAVKPESTASEGRSRLQLDSAQLSLSATTAQAAEAVAAAAQARAAEAEAAASAAQQRMRDMEVELARIRAEAKAQTEALVALKQQIAQDQSQRQQQTWLVPLLLAATGLLALMALWLAWRARQQRPATQGEAWWEHGPASVQPQHAEESGFRASTLRPSTSLPLPLPPAPLVSEQRSAEAVGLDSLIAPATVAAPMAVTIPPAPPMPREPEAQRAVTVDEQIDLEQQADFFIALGHDESAIDLLMAHLRSTGGGTPLPFLKLLEIHRRRGDREAYERTRVRFNQRFNSIAPDWNTDPKVGRSLEEYPLVVGRIQHAWAAPLDAMAELEALLFRRGAGAELFDLPAYQELLFLYQLARDLHQGAQPEDAQEVDVLLPIGGSAEPVPEGTIVLRPEFNAGEEVKLDLDLGHEIAPASVAESRPDIEFDLGPDEAKPSTSAEDVWSDDPESRRRE